MAAFKDSRAHVSRLVMAGVNMRTMQELMVRKPSRQPAGSPPPLGTDWLQPGDYAILIKLNIPVQLQWLPELFDTMAIVE
jgi:hypothetical protein